MVEKKGKIVLKGLALLGRHGASVQEQGEGQPFLVDLELQFPFPQNDDLTSTVDYARAVSVVQALVEGQSCALLETLAQEIARELLQVFPRLEKVGVRVHKPRAPLPITFDDLFVEYWLERNSLGRTGQ